MRSIAARSRECAFGLGVVFESTAMRREHRMALSEVAANVYFVFAGCGRYLDGPIERARLVYRALWFLPVVSQNVVDSGVDRYLILVRSGSGSVRIPSQIL